MKNEIKQISSLFNIDRKILTPMIGQTKLDVGLLKKTSIKIMNSKTSKVLFSSKICLVVSCFNYSGVQIYYTFEEEKKEKNPLSEFGRHTVKQIITLLHVKTRKVDMQLGEFNYLFLDRKNFSLFICVFCSPGNKFNFVRKVAGVWLCKYSDTCTYGSDYKQIFIKQDHNKLLQRCENMESIQQL